MNIFDFFEYDQWATNHLVAATQALTPAQFIHEFDGPLTSVRQQFVHLLRVTDRYRARLAGAAVPDILPESFSTPPELLQYSKQMRLDLNRYLASLDEGDLNRVQEHVTLNGTFRTTVQETLQHMVNHSTYHRGQVAFMLKLHGIDFPDTDIIIWLDMRSK